MLIFALDSTAVTGSVALCRDGKPLAASQYADYPNYKVYDEVDITDLVNVGDNVLAVIGYAQGEDSSVYRLE